MSSTERSVLYIDMAYTVEMVRQKQHLHFFEMRHAEGFFDRVWGVHPIADVAGKASRSIDFIPITDRQTIVEGVAESLPLPRFLIPLNFLISQWKLLRRLRRLMIEEEIDLIHATDGYYSGLFGLILKRLTRRPEVVSVLANQDDLYAATGALAMPRLLRFRFVERIVIRLVLSRADQIIVGNRNNFNFVLANGATPDRTAIIPVAKSIERIHQSDPASRGSPDDFLRAHGIAPGASLMLFVSRLVALKHPDDAVRAMAEVIRQRPEAVGLVAGDGPLQAELEALAESLGAQGRIHFLGQVDQPTLSKLIPRCITISPLTGLALIECGLGGSPIVAYDRDWQAEFVEDGVNGFVVPFLDHGAMAERAVRLIDDPVLRERFSKAARERALEFGDRDRIHAQEQAIYARLLEESRA